MSRRAVVEAAAAAPRDLDLETAGADAAAVLRLALARDQEEEKTVNIVALVIAVRRIDRAIVLEAARRIVRDPEATPAIARSHRARNDPCGNAEIQEPFQVQVVRSSSGSEFQSGCLPSSFVRPSHPGVPVEDPLLPALPASVEPVFEFGSSKSSFRLPVKLRVEPSLLISSEKEFNSRYQVMARVSQR